MSSLFGGGPKPPPPAPPPPQIDDAIARINEQDRTARRSGRRTTVLTGDTGLPDLGTTTKVTQ